MNVGFGEIMLDVVLVLLNVSNIMHGYQIRKIQRELKK